MQNKLTSLTRYLLQRYSCKDTRASEIKAEEKLHTVKQPLKFFLVSSPTSSIKTKTKSIPVKKANLIFLRNFFSQKS